MKILIVEDDAAIASFLVKGLRAEGYSTAVAKGGVEALDILRSLRQDLDLTLLDLGLPDIDGYEVLRRIRAAHPDIPIIVLTARDSVHDKVRGLDAGANDYVTKPFHFEELLARVRASVRHDEQKSSAELSVGDLRFDLMTKVAWRKGRRIDLSQREWSLLELFLRHPHQILTRTQILSHVWDYDFDPGSNVVDVYIGYLRRKLNFSGVPPLIETVRGAGYRLVPPGTSMDNK